MRRHLGELRAQGLDGLVRLRRRGAVAADGGLAAGARAAGGEAGRAGGGREGRDGRGRVGRRALAAGDGVVALAAVVLFPEALYPLQELEVVSANSAWWGVWSEEVGVTGCVGGDVLHLAFHEFLHGDRL